MSKIKHEPKFYVRLCRGKSRTFAENFTIYEGAIYGRFSDKNENPIFWVCDNYCLKDGKLPVHILNGKYWSLHFVEENHPCYKWVRAAIKELGRVPKIKESFTQKECKNMMKTYTLPKKRNGSRINTHQINSVLKWNEVTELAHWNEKGKASVVACNIR